MSVKPVSLGIVQELDGAERPSAIHFFTKIQAAELAMVWLGIPYALAGACSKVSVHGQ